jgi:predicted component of type VI protein secretion system
MQPNDSFRLIVRRGPQPNQTYDLNKDIITLGRDITNDIVINDPEVSRHHMRLTRGAGGFTLEDLGSTNGTFVNGQRLTGAKPLTNGDMIGLGETVTLGYEMVREGRGAPGAAEDMQTAPNQVASRPPVQQPTPAGSAPPGPPPSYNYSPPSSQQPPQPSYSPPPPQAPPGAGYDYDPYAVREEEPSNTMRWVLIGCAGISLFCCCATVVSAFIIDSACLWNRIPIVWDIMQAVGYTLGSQCNIP